jgi:hypothetical protein
MIIVTNIENAPEYGGVRVHIKPAKVLIEDFSDEAIVFTPNPINELPEADIELPINQSGPNYSSGAGAGSIAAIQYLLVEGSADKKRLDEAYRRIDELERKMGDMWDKVESGYIDLENNIITVNSKIVDRNDSQKSSTIESFNLNDKQVYILPDQSHKELKNIKWLSEDSTFITRANLIRSQLTGARLDSPLKREFYDISKHSLVHADRVQFSGDAEGADFLLDVAQKSADVLVGLDPYTGFARGVYETFTGKNLITNTVLTDGERTVAALGVLTGGVAVSAMKAYRLILPIAKKMAPHLMKSYQAIRQFLTKTGNGFELVGEGSKVRRIHLRSDIEPSFGFRPKHLNKHFFGNSRYALNVIDPKGSTDIWMNNIMDLAQKAPTKTYPDGVIDIIETFEKADKAGVYKMGIRLRERADKSYDIITILTDQRR